MLIADLTRTGHDREWIFTKNELAEEKSEIARIGRDSG